MVPAHALGRTVRFEPTAEGWRRAARWLVRDRVHPDAVVWEPTDDPQTTLCHAGPAVDSPDPPGSDHSARANASDLRVPRAFLRLVVAAVCHRSPTRWTLLYRVLWRLQHGEPHLLDIVTDSDVHALGVMERAVRRAAHKMKAFVRFRRATGENDPDPIYVACF